MTEHFLNGMDIRTVFQQMCRERMAQRMRCDCLFDAGLRLVVLEEITEALTLHPFTNDVDQQILFIPRCDNMRTDEINLFI